MFFDVAKENEMKRIVVVIAVIMVAVVAMAATDRLDAERARLDRNRQAVTAFYTMFMNDHDPEGAMKKYVGTEYRQHNPFVRDGKEGFIAAFKDVFKRVPKARMEIKRVVAEGDFVVVHVHHLDPTGGKGRASMDWFRLDPDGKIVEHWDVMQWVPEDNEVMNQNTMF
jgi:predicted SnoaL-like aldol condensation-catalyzing enzyme